MKILALDTSTRACSVAVYINGEIIERLAVVPQKHIEVLMPMVKEVMEEADLQFSDLDGLAFTAGPGSFAGLRIACGFVQGLGSGLNIPIVPVSTLATLALPVFDDYPNAIVLPIMDAKMQEVYWGIYQKAEEGKLITLIEDQVSTLEVLYQTIKERAFEVVGVGDGWLLDPKIKEQLMPRAVLDEPSPRAGDVALLALSDIEQGLGLYADQVSPTYLRENIALTLEEQEALRAKKAQLHD